MVNFHKDRIENAFTQGEDAIFDKSAADVTKSGESVPLPFPTEWVDNGDGTQKISNVSFRVGANDANLDQFLD